MKTCLIFQSKDNGINLIIKKFGTLKDKDDCD